MNTFVEKNKKTLIIVGIIAIVVIWVVSGYNGFVSKSAAVDGQWAQVENQLQRRFDLIPNLEATVKGIAKQEKDVFGALAEARSRYAGAATTDAKAKAAGEYESAIGRLLVITENYPSLQSSTSFNNLMISLEGTENRIAVERMKYNDAVKAYNVSTKRFPSNILAGIFNFSAKEFFQVPEAAKEVPKVEFN